MKKIAALAASAALVLALCGCRASQEQISGAQQNNEPAVESQTAKKASMLTPLDTSATIPETLLVNENGVTVAATSIEFKQNDLKLNISISNNSGEPVTVSAGTLGYSYNWINNYMTDDGYLNAEVEPGAVSEEVITFSEANLLGMGITEVSEIGVGLRIEGDATDFLVLTEPVAIKTSLSGQGDEDADTLHDSIDRGYLAFYAQETEYPKNFGSDELVYDQRGLQISDAVLAQGAEGDWLVLMQAKNTTDVQSVLSVSNVSCDDVCYCEGLWSGQRIAPGKRALVALQLNNMIDELACQAVAIGKPAKISCDIGQMDQNGNDIAYPMPIEFDFGGISSLNTEGETVYSDDDVQVIFKGFYEDDLEYAKELHGILLIKNNSDESYSFGVDYGSVVANGKALLDTTFSSGALPGGYGVLDVEFMDYSVDDDERLSLDTLSEVEAVLELRKGSRGIVAEPSIIMRAQ